MGQLVGGNKRRILVRRGKQKQIQMDIKLEGEQHSEKVLVEQVKILRASILLIGSGSSDRFVSWLKRTPRSSNYCANNVPIGCSVITVKNWKVVHFKNNQMNASSEIAHRDAEAASSSEESEVQHSGLLNAEASSFLENVVEAHYTINAEEEKEEEGDKALECCNSIEGSLTSDVVKNQVTQDKENSCEGYFDMMEEEDWEGAGEEGCKNSCERTQENSIREVDSSQQNLVMWVLQLLTGEKDVSTDQQRIPTMCYYFWRVHLIQRTILRLDILVILIDIEKLLWSCRKSTMLQSLCL